MRNFVKNGIFAVLFIALLGGFLGFTATGANADSSTGSGDDYTFKLNYNLSDQDSDATKYAYNHTSTVKSLTNPQGKVMGMPVSHPSAHWQKTYAKKCRTFQTYPSKAKLNKLKPTTWVIKRSKLKQFRKAAMTDKIVKRLPHHKVKVSAVCFFVVHGKFPDTVKRVDGQVKGWSHSIETKHGKMLFELVTVRQGKKVAKVPVRRGQSTNGKTFNYGDCGNKKAAVITYQEKDVAYGDFTSFYWHDKGEAKASIHVGGSGTISYGNCSSTYFLDMYVSGTASFDVLVSGKTATDARNNAAKVVNKHSAYASAAASAEASVKAQLEIGFSKEGCGSTPPPTSHEAPAISVNPGACVKQGETSGTVTVTVTNPNDSASPADVTVGSTTKHADSVAGNGGHVTLTFPGYGPGTYGVTAVLTAFNKSATTQVTVAKCDTPPAPTMALSIDKMNDLDQSVVPSDGPIEWSWTDLQAHATAPTGAGNVTYTVGSDYGTTKFNANNTTSLTQASGTYDLSLRYTAPTEVPAGGYDTITITAVFGGKTYSASTQIRINPTPTIPR